MTGGVPQAQGRMSLWPLFLISGAAVGFEIALTRRESDADRAGMA